MTSRRHTNTALITALIIAFVLGLTVLFYGCFELISRLTSTLRPPSNEDKQIRSFLLQELESEHYTRAWIHKYCKDRCTVDTLAEDSVGMLASYYLWLDTGKVEREVE